MNPRFKDYFHFSSIERKGILSLFLILGIILFANQALYYFQGDFEVNSELAEQMAADLKAKSDSLKALEEQIANESPNRNKNESSFEAEEETPELFNFNPNNLSVVKWQKLGLSKQQAEVIKNYEASGGNFRVKSDVEKMYTISAEKFADLEPYILLPDEIKSNITKSSGSLKDDKKSYKKKWEPVVVDLNTADSAELQKVYGLGPFFSGKIVKLREDLGGFHSKEQLLEIWNFSDSLLEALDSNLLIKSTDLKKINVNKASAKELKRHHYIDWNIANSIVNLRAQHGKYEELEDIKQSVLINDSIFLKLKPYLVAD